MRKASIAVFDFGEIQDSPGSPVCPGSPKEVGTLGTAEFVFGLERLRGSRLPSRAPGRKPAASVSGEQPELPQ
jgi:hypothetical protein